MREEDIANLALKLPNDARALLADRLVESLDPAEDGFIHTLWGSEATRRLQELRSGKVVGISGEEALVFLLDIAAIVIFGIGLGIFLIPIGSL